MRVNNQVENAICQHAEHELPVADTSESLPELSPQAVRHLEHLLYEYLEHIPDHDVPNVKYYKRYIANTVLSEWLTLAATVKRRAPAHLIPRLLQVAAENIHLRPAIATVLNRVHTETFLSFSTWWAIDNDFDRLRIGLEHLRSQDAAKAREFFQALLKEKVETESGYNTGYFLQNKLQLYLPIFVVNLSHADEDFLNTCLTADCSIRAKTIARHLLAQLPDSPLSQRHRQRLSQWFHFEKGGVLKKDRCNDKLIIEVPDDYDPSWAADGIEKDRLGCAKDWWFEQNLGFISPTYLSEHLQLSPSEVLTLIKTHEWRSFFLHGLYVSSYYHLNDEDWAEAFIIQNLWKGDKSCFWRTLPPLRAEKVATYLLTRKTKNKTNVLREVNCLNYQWSIELSTLLINTLINNEKYVTTRQFRKIYCSCRYTGFADNFAPVPECIDLLVDYQKCTSDEYVANGIGEMIARLNFRRDMIAALTTPEN